jgi:hypothetical protein
VLWVAGDEKRSEHVCFQKRVRVVRLSLAFLLAPAIVAFWLSISMDAVLEHLHWEPSDIANILLGTCWLMDGVAIPYLCALFLGLPYVLIMSARARLNFWTVMAPIAALSLVYALSVYSSLCSFHPAHPFAEAVGALQIPAVIGSGLCFYLLGVWRLRGRREPGQGDSRGGGQEG